MRDWHLDPAPGYEPLIGRFVTMLTDTRRRLHRDLEDLRPEELDGIPAWGANSISTLLYHVAAIELDWTFADLLGRGEDGFPEGTADWFPVDVREDDGRLTPVIESLQQHLDRLEWVRGHLLDTLRGMSDADLDRTFNEGDPDAEIRGGVHPATPHAARGGTPRPDRRDQGGDAGVNARSVTIAPAKDRQGASGMAQTCRVLSDATDCR